MPGKLPQFLRRRSAEFGVYRAQIWEISRPGGAREGYFAEEKDWGGVVGVTHKSVVVVCRVWGGGCGICSVCGGTKLVTFFWG